MNGHQHFTSDIVPADAMPDGPEEVSANQPTQDSSSTPAHRDPDIDAAASAPTQPGHSDAPAAREPDIAAASAPTEPGRSALPTAYEPGIAAALAPIEPDHSAPPTARGPDIAAASAPTQPGHSAPPEAQDRTRTRQPDQHAAQDPTRTSQPDRHAAQDPTRTSQPDEYAVQTPTRTSEPDRRAAQDLVRPSRPGAATAATPLLIQPKPGVPQPRNPARYHMIGEHGRGGLGKVSRAHDLELGRDVAIKELLSRSAMHEVRFMREALITARLEHPGIVPVHEAGRWPDGTPFYAMKLVSGRPLRDLIAERKTVDDRIGLLHHVIAVADAIAYAHGRNIIHRDLKPSNVIIGDFGETIVSTGASPRT